jgi:DnaJ-class molecular chaperone
MSRPDDAVTCPVCEGTGLCGGDDPEPCDTCSERGWFAYTPDVAALVAQVEFYQPFALRAMAGAVLEREETHGAE